MKIYKKTNVFEESLDRIRFLFDEFEEVVVSFSGGKDSTVILNLALMVAKEKNRLPLTVSFIDQEAEWAKNIEYIRRVMNKPEINPRWFQMHIRIFNATSYSEPWLQCWEPGKKHMREKEPNAITENVYGTLTFKELFGKIREKDYKNVKMCDLTGVRTEENPIRFLGLTSHKTYKHITWGAKTKNPNHFTFSPIYDWSYKDVWKAIYDNNWDYCEIYDYLYRYGTPVQDMRISNLHHETALESLKRVQEIEPKTWESLTERMTGVNVINKMSFTEAFNIKKLPKAFRDWREYRDYLVENLTQNEETKNIFRNRFKQMEESWAYMPEDIKESMLKEQTKSVVFNDYHFTKLNNFIQACNRKLYNRGIKWKLKKS